MIAELFWPKEMKELVKKYRAEGTCNEEAVRYVNKAIWKHISIFLIIAFMLLTTSEVMAAGILFLLTPLFVWFDIRNLFRKQMLPYIEGKKTDVEFARVIRYYAGKQKVIFLSKNKERIICCLNHKPNLRKEDFPDTGQIVSIYQNNQAKHNAMPDIDYLKEKYSLTTTIL